MVDKTLAEDYATFVALYEKTGQLENYHNDASSSLSITNKLSYKVETHSDYDHGKSRIESTTYIDEQNMGTSTIYIDDGKIYYDNLDGSKTSDEFTDSLSNMNDLFINENDIATLEVQPEQLVMTLNDEACVAMLKKNGLAIDESRKCENKLIVEHDEEHILSQTLDITFTVVSAGVSYDGTYNYMTSYQDIDKATVTLPSDYSLYIDIDDLKPDMTLEEFKYALINTLGYSIDDYGQYVLDFNGNESYIFDFSNDLFTYIKGQSAYTYNWQSNIGAYNACTYDFGNAKAIGNCSDVELDKIEEAKVSYLTELSFIGIYEMPKG
ncbi:MAG: hypothetical protein MR210_08650 [Erysipelotrichaceae bacterium]|nr:hypothetical protein [Erysipelotrichaceae bacterium]MDY5251465.1 hypothetical protein [Erysipelotrichaceae bacterium]